MDSPLFSVATAQTSSLARAATSTSFPLKAAMCSNSQVREPAEAFGEASLPLEPAVSAEPEAPESVGSAPVPHPAAVSSMPSTATATPHLCLIPAALRMIAPLLAPPRSDSPAFPGERAAYPLGTQTWRTANSGASARRVSRRRDVHAALGEGAEGLGEKVVRLTAGCEHAREVLAGSRRVVPEQRGGGGVAEGAAEAVVDGGQAGAEVPSRTVDRLTQGEIEAWCVGDMSAVEFVGVAGRPVRVCPRGRSRTRSNQARR